MVNVSDDLTWQIVRGYNAYKVKSHSITLTREPFNVMNIPSRKFSGLANSKAVGVNIDKRGNSVMTLKTKAAPTQPKKGTHVVKLNTHGRGAKACNKSVQSVVAGTFYRPDLARLAKARVSQQAKASVRKQMKVKYTPKKRSNKQ